MAAPTVVSTAPQHDESNVYLNKRIVAVFSESMDSDSINDNTIRLIHTPTNSRVWTEWSLSDDGLTLTITPKVQLDSEETYTLTLVGVDLGFAFYLKSETDDGLVVSYRVRFTTGNDIEAYSAEKTDLTSEREGDLVLPVDLQVVPGERLEVLATSPQHHSAGLSTELSQVTMRFSAALSGELLDVDSEWLTINCYPLMGYSEYLAQPTGESFVFAIDDPVNDSGEAYTFDWPSGEVTATGEYLIWSRDTGDLDNVFPYNTEIEVLLSPDVQDNYGNTLQETRRFVFTVEATPLFDAVRGIERELPTLPEEFDRDLIYALIWKYSIDAWQKLASANPPTKAYHHIRKYVHSSVCLDILDNAELPKTILAGQKKILGDFTVHYESAAVGKEGLKYKRLKKDLEDATNALSGRRRNQPRVGVRGSSFDRPNWKNRTWRSALYYNPSYHPGRPITEIIPASNTAASRDSELPGQLEGWS